MWDIIPSHLHTVLRLCQAVFWSLLITAVCFPVGCRTLVQRKSNLELVAARQLSLRGADALQRSRAQDAEMLFSEALRRSPLDERAHWGYACTLWNRGDRTRAIEHMREALRLSGALDGSKKNPEYAIRLGEMSLEMGDRASASEAAKGVLAVDRNHAKAWALLGDMHQSERDWDAALECYNRALLIQSNYPRVQLSVAEINRIMGRPQRALAVLDRMSDLQSTASTDPDVLLIRGQALADLHRPADAAEALAMASERMSGDRVDKQIELVRAQHRIGELVPARMTLGKLIASNTGHPEVARLQSMLDMSFAHLSDPSAPLRTAKSALPEAQIHSSPTGEPAVGGLGFGMTPPLSMPETGAFLRR
ncbi:MAG: tetratricopeptide repeat protein [Pirellula sp.]